MKKPSLEEWRKEGIDSFGVDMKKWKFKCPKCGNIQTIEDIEMIGVEHADTKVFNECGLCGVELKNENSIHQTEIIDAQDNPHPSFEFATKEDVESFEKTALDSLMSAGKEEAEEPNEELKTDFNPDVTDNTNLNTSTSENIEIENLNVQLSETIVTENSGESEDNTLSEKLDEREEKETLVPEANPEQLVEEYIPFVRDETIIEEESKESDINAEDKAKEQIEKIGELKQNLEEIRESNPDSNPDNKPEEE